MANGKWTAIFVGLAAAVVQGCAVPTHAITTQFSADLSRVWCVTEDLYLVHNPSGGWWTGEPRLLAIPAAPAAMAIRKPDMRATIPKGSRFRVVKVMNRTSSSYGFLAYDHMLAPFIVFEPPFDRAGTVDAGGLRSIHRIPSSCHCGSERQHPATAPKQSNCASRSAAANAIQLLTPRTTDSSANSQISANDPRHTPLAMYFRRAAIARSISLCVL